jgi:hypothetical protein
VLDYNASPGPAGMFPKRSDSDGILAVPDEYNLLTTQIFGNMIEYNNLLDGRLRAGESFTSSITILGNEFELPKWRLCRSTRSSN